MRVLIFFTVFLIAQGSVSMVSAQDVVPKRTWDADTPRTVQPFNLKSILRGDKQPRSSASTTNKRKGRPTSRNPIEVLKEGGELEYSEALLSTADYNDARAALRLQNRYIGKSNEEAALIMAEVKLEEQEKLEKMRARRSEFYMKRGLSDKDTREYFQTAGGRLARKEIREEMRAKIETEKLKLELAEMNAEERAEAVSRIERERAEPKNRSRTIVPTAQPGNDGKIKPFFYR